MKLSITLCVAFLLLSFSFKASALSLSSSAMPKAVIKNMSSTSHWTVSEKDGSSCEKLVFGVKLLDSGIGKNQTVTLPVLTLMNPLIYLDLKFQSKTLH